MFGTIQPDHPAGKSLCGNQPPIVACLPPFAKYFASRFTQIISTSAPVLAHRGALRNVINAGRDAVDAGGRRSRVVPTPRRLVSSRRKMIPLATVAKEPGHRGEHEGNR